MGRPRHGPPRLLHREMTDKMFDSDVAKLFNASRETLMSWVHLQKCPAPRKTFHPARRKWRRTWTRADVAKLRKFLKSRVDQRTVQRRPDQLTKGKPARSSASIEAMNFFCSIGKNGETVETLLGQIGGAEKFPLGDGARFRADVRKQFLALVKQNPPQEAPRPRVSFKSNRLAHPPHRRAGRNICYGEYPFLDEALAHLSGAREVVRETNGR
jgi:hypothetical protein